MGRREGFVKIIWLKSRVAVLPNTGTLLVPEYFCLIPEQIVLKEEQIVYRFWLLHSGLIASFQNNCFIPVLICFILEQIF